MSPEDAYRAVHAELAHDDATGPNWGSFATTRMDPFAEALIVENLGKNFVCASEYESVHRIHDRLVGMLSRLFHCPDPAVATGTATAGSSEAIQLALLAHKWSWKARRQLRGEPTHRPNIVFFGDAHVCWDKFARYFDVEARKVPLQRTGGQYTYSLDALRREIDENTICVGAVIGTTYTGDCHPIAEIDAMLVGLKRDRGWNIPIHVDAASAGFVLPFVDDARAPIWDFRLEQVRSINVSGHKFGLVYPGLGWLLFRESADLPRELVFDAPYLGGPLQTYTLNFSRGSAMIVAQYYNFLKLGENGYREVMSRCVANARRLADRLHASGHFEIIGAPLLPILCFRCREGGELDARVFSKMLREKGWVVPAYAMPADAELDTVLRVVVHERFTSAMVDDLFEDMRSICERVTSRRRAADAPTVSVGVVAGARRSSQWRIPVLPSAPP